MLIVQYFSNTAMCIIGVIHINFFYTLVFMILKPYKERKEFKNEIWNEIAILLMSYTLLFFSEDFVDPQSRETIGFEVIGFTSLLIFLNFVPVLFGALVLAKTSFMKKIYPKCCKKSLQRRAKLAWQNA